MTGLRLFVFGSTRLERDGQTVKVDRRKALALLVYLAVTGEPHRRDALAALLWPDDDHTHARAALRRALAALKVALASDVLEADREEIGLRREGNGGSLWLDAGRFQHLLATCRAHGHPEADVCPHCLEPLTEAVALYRGDFLAGFTLRDTAEFDDWQLFQAEALRRDLAGALDRLVRGHSARQEFELAIGHARRWLAMDPLEEPAHRSLMSLYAWTGRRQAARRQFAECARLLERELGVTPQESTTQLYEAIERNALPPPAEILSRPAWARAQESVRLAPRSGRQAAATYPDQALSLLDRIVRGRLVGRERELAEMRALWKRVASGEGHVLFVSGEAGVGKTRLVREVCTEAAGAGGTVLSGRCDAEGGAPYAPIAQLIRAVFDDPCDHDLNMPNYIMADLLALAPHLRSRYPRISPNPPLDPQFERQRSFDSFVSWCGILAGRGPLLLLVEDVHWADSGTLSLLRHLAQEAASVRLLLVLTYRDSEVGLAETRAIEDMVLNLNRQRLSSSVRLARLNRAQTHDLLAVLLATGGEITAEFRDSIYRETEGNPFFVEEVCKALIEDGKLYFAGGHWRRSDIGTMVIPRSVRAAILSRVERLPSPVQETLRWAAALGREFDVPTLQAMGAWDEETLHGALEHAARAQLLEETQRVGHVRFAFTHALIPFTVREGMSGFLLQRLHRRAAAVIEAQRPDDVEALAYHFAAAGEPGKAVDYARRAAQRAQALYAYDTAIQHLQTALDLIEADEPPVMRLAVLEQLADLLVLRGERAEAIPIYQEALELWQSQMDAVRWVAVRLCRKIGETFLHLASNADIQRFESVSGSSLESGLRLIEGQPPHLEAVRLLTTLANDVRGVRAQQDWDAAERYARAAVAMAEQLDAPVELSSALASLDTIYGVRGLFRERVTLALRRVDLSRDMRFRDLRERCNVMCQTGNALLLVGEYVRALPYLTEAEKLADQIRDITQEVYALGLQAQCFFGLDRWDEMLQIEEKRQALEERYGYRRVGIMCFYCGLSANVMTLRGDYERARYWRNIAYNHMAGFFGGPPEVWTARAGHY